MMVSLYEILKSAKIGSGKAPDMYTALMAKNMPFAKGSEHEYTGLCPYNFIGNGTQLLDWYIKGNMNQQGTPSPSSIIMPDECGDKTANLSNKIIENANISAEGLIATASGYNIMVAPVTQGEIYSGTGYVYAFFENEPNIRSVSYNQSRVVNNFKNVTAPINGYVAVRYAPVSESPMINKGSTTLPYEPMGYKIPILSGGTTTNVYLGEVETTRKIKKYEFTGEESISDIGDYYNTNVSVLSVAWSATTSTTGGFQINNGGNRIWAIKSYFSSYATAADFKTYLQQQYSAGTPVTVWYVLATPTTGIVNEPIRKIGNYADSISNVASIPTTAGSQTFDVDTTLKPSEIYLKWKK